MTEIFHDVLTFIELMFIVFITSIVTVSVLARDNVLKRLLVAFCARFAVTLGAGAIALPIEWVPGVDLMYDIGAPIAVIYIWYTFFRDAGRLMPLPASAANDRIIEHTPRLGE